jgi:predicted RecA/RadA family phage recombinase
VAVFIQEGAAVDYTPSVNTSAGSVIVQGDLVGIVKHDIRTGALGSIAVEGVFDIDKDDETVFAAGDLVYWDATAGQAVTTALGNKLLGKAIADAPADTTVVRTRLSQ